VELVDGHEVRLERRLDDVGREAMARDQERAGALVGRAAGADQDLANPLGTILSAARMLRWTLGQPEAAAAIEAAVDDALDAGYRTRDLLPPRGAGENGLRVVGTREMARVIGDRIAI
jgi:isocitrate/isopropylmalate dehydrogenase